MAFQMVLSLGICTSSVFIWINWISPNQIFSHLISFRTSLGWGNLTAEFSHLQGAKGVCSNVDTFTKKSTDLSYMLVSHQYFLLRLQSVCDCYFLFLPVPPRQHSSPAQQWTYQDEEGEGCSPVTLSAQLWFLPFLHSPRLFAFFIVNSQS